MLGTEEKTLATLGTGRYKTAEKDITLAVAHKTAAYIEERVPGVRIVMTRTGDTYPTLPDGFEWPTKPKPTSSFPSTATVSKNHPPVGSSTFVMGLGKSEASLRVASKENAAIFQENSSEAKGFDPNDPDTFIALALKQEIYLERSLQLADLIQTQFRERVGRKDRGVRQAGYYVTAYANMPSVLVELGFLTNPKEEDFLRSEKGQDYMASALFRAFRSYAETWFSLESAVEPQANVPSEAAEPKETTPADQPEAENTTPQSPAWFGSLSNTCSEESCALLCKRPALGKVVHCWTVKATPSHSHNPPCPAACINTASAHPPHTRPLARCAIPCG